METRRLDPDRFETGVLTGTDSIYCAGRDPTRNAQKARHSLESPYSSRSSADTPRKPVFPSRRTYDYLIQEAEACC